MKFISTNPSDNYLVLGEVQVSTTADIANAVATARKAQVEWASMPLAQRCAAIRSFGDVARKRADDIKNLIALETGRPISTLDSHLDMTFDYLNGYCDSAFEHLAPVVTTRNDKEIQTVYREPWGVVAAIAPWNYPFLNIMWQSGQALIAGNAIVFKTSEENPLFSQLVAELFAESDVPDGVFNVVFGDGAVGQILAESDVDLISFTGSSATGRKLAAIAAERLIPFVGEMGGSSPGIVFDDVDVDEYLDDIFWNRFSHSGQFCDALKRLIVHETKFEEITTKLVSMAESMNVGPAIDPDTELGPLVAKRQVERIASQVDDARERGATVLTGGKSPSEVSGAYYSPTILTNVTRDMRVWNEETFGPALPVVPFSSEAQAIELANDTDYGLSAFVFTSDSDRYARVAAALQAGAIAQNHAAYCHPESPFGGFKKSGLGRTGGKYGFDDVTQVKLIAQHLDP